ncbi:MAG: hypothetical protein BJ554DRAFT_5619 [Olpidium bornovanus]|uniref:DUF1748-domain-containing protein n=1 Tax=Olpidium bornovanus TaxID=278681 RepID=A0A8H7ZZ25_9FUNG|nr:MAG: hypothetical protein BJ554DRAFT_5619 [Olpidium bornovanus]
MKIERRANKYSETSGLAFLKNTRVSPGIIASAAASGIALAGPSFCSAHHSCARLTYGSANNVSKLREKVAFSRSFLIPFLELFPSSVVPLRVKPPPRTLTPSMTLSVNDLPLRPSLIFFLACAIVSPLHPPRPPPIHRRQLTPRPEKPGLPPPASLWLPGAHSPPHPSPIQMSLGRLVHFTVDAILVSAVLAGIKSACVLCKGRWQTLDLDANVRFKALERPAFCRGSAANPSRLPRAALPSLLRRIGWSDHCPARVRRGSGCRCRRNAAIH